MPSCAEAVDNPECSVSLKRDMDRDKIAPPLKRQKSNGRNYPCSYDGCDKSFKKPCRLQEHFNTHTGQRPFKCDQCDKDYMKSSHLAAHKQSHVPAKRYSCSHPGCDVTTSTRQHLKTHEALHSEPAPYKCTDYPPCHASFRKKHLLRQHITGDHTHAPLFPCPHADEGCPFASDMQSKLLQHIQKRHTTKYFCEECGEGFIQLLDMMRHKRDTHRPRCFTCDVEFTNQEVLKNHLTTHRTTLDERKKYACQVEGCNKRYTKPFALKNHVRTVHEKEKRFVCPFEGCGQAFGFKKVLQRHELTHTQPASPRPRKVVKEVGIIDGLVGPGFEETERSINCSVEGCEWRFTRDYDLNRHLASFHQRDGEDMDTNLAAALDLNTNTNSVAYGIDLPGSFVF